MSKDSRIEWTHHTFNPWWGCTKVSPGCKHCYAESWAKRLGQNVWGAGAPRRELTSAYWKQPATWNAEAARTRTRARVFCASMADVFEVQWDFPNTEPPEYLAKLAPTVYQAEQQKAQARMQEAIALAEQAFLIELDALIKSLHERLTPGPDGAKKVFRDSTIKNLGDFFTKFKTLNIGSNEQLDNLVDQANDLIKGINPADLRDSALLRTEINKGLAEISGKLDPLVTNLPRRKIIMPKQE